MKQDPPTRMDMHDDVGRAYVHDFVTQLYRVPADADALYVLMHLIEVLHKAGDILPDDARDHLLIAGAAAIAIAKDLD